MSHDAIDRLTRGAVAVETRAELERKLESGRKLRVKLGMDPTAPDVHLGHAVVLRRLRAFQDLGHEGVLIIGDFTALVGDPSGQSKTRPMLSSDEIEANVRTYLEQVGKVVDVKALEIRHNSEWFSRMGFVEVIALLSKITVARILERDDFSKRMKARSPVGVHELLYPVMQGWDSVQIKADVELGGTDQTFNILMGRDLQRTQGQEPQVLLTTPLLPGLDGVEKMSKSLGNYVGFTDPPGEMFGKLMSLPDSLMKSYVELLTSLREDQMGALHPRDAKEKLAREVVGFFHGSDAAANAAEEFNRVFSRRELPSDIPELKLDANELSAAELLVRAGHASSNKEARRLIAQGAVELDGERIADARARLVPKDGQVLKTGKRRFARIRVE